jgi:hypothetical protein
MRHAMDGPEAPCGGALIVNSDRLLIMTFPARFPELEIARFQKRPQV